MLILDFAHPRSVDARLVGGKACGLATMTREGIPVAPGFSVSTLAYRDYVSSTGLRARLDALLGAVNRDSLDTLDRAARTIAQWFDDTPLPSPLHAAVGAAYADLCRTLAAPDVSVAVRSSATAEDAADASFAGEYETFVGLRGSEAVELHMRRCWASAFTPRALAYAWKNGISPLDVEMAVVVQKTVDARASGVMFTISPVTGDRSRIVIEAAYGLGLGVVGGEVTPDRYVVAKIEGHVVERIVGDKHVEYLCGHEATAVDAERRGRLCLDDGEVLALAALGRKLERLHGAPQDIEFAIDRQLPPGANIVLLQCRPVTVLPKTNRPSTASSDSLSRLAASVLGAARAH